MGAGGASGISGSQWSGFRRRPSDVLDDAVVALGAAVDLREQRPVRAGSVSNRSTQIFTWSMAGSPTDPKRGGSRRLEHPARWRPVEQHLVGVCGERVVRGFPRPDRWPHLRPGGRGRHRLRRPPDGQGWCRRHRSAPTGRPIPRSQRQRTPHRPCLVVFRSDGISV